MADVNGDGLLDIYVSSVNNRYGLKGHNELFINQGNGRFKEQSKEYGLDASCFTTQAVFFDYDHDGDLDCFILNQSHHPHANIVDTRNRRKYDSLSGNRLYRNDLNTPAKKFTDVSAEAGIFQSNLGIWPGHCSGRFQQRWSLELIELFGNNLTDHAATAVANLLGSAPRLEQSVFAEGITAESAEHLGVLARKLWAQARTEMIAQASRCFEQDHDKPDANHRMRFGVYYWDESATPDPDESSARRHESEDD